MELIGIIIVGCGIFFIGLFFALICTVGIENTIVKIIVTIILAIVFSSLLVGVCYLEDKADKDNWNNGICSQCGGSLDFKNASRYKGRTTYFWECEECGYIIETTKNMREE